MIQLPAIGCKTGMPCWRKTFDTLTIRKQDKKFSVCRGEDRGRRVGEAIMLAEVHTGERQFDKLNVSYAQY